MSEQPPIAQAILAQAAAWLLLMQEGPLTPTQRLELEHWRYRDAEHERAWNRAQRLLSRLGTLPPTLARQTLVRPDSSRRTVLRTLLVLLGAAPLGWWAWRRSEGGIDYLTARGERRDVLLADGTQVSLNSDSELSVRFTAEQRLLHLRRGEIYIATAADPSRPLRVRTGQGVMQALGTRFSVRQFPQETLLAVYEGAVQVQPEAAGGVIVQAGSQLRFSRDRFDPLEDARDAQLAWRNGLLVIDEMPLLQWTQELMRYSDQRLVCDPALAELRVSGSFPIDDLPLALAMLAQSHKLRIRSEAGGTFISR
ncbi:MULTISPECIES: FecR family protein [unclassified Pseudomonas]|uniref:FecR family protein n=1 Tax=unclassified Pseudomonas TaxID=196821 RepID=UPI000C889703|nr:MULTISPECIES: FecR family protein [unclassified Pseudomonas]PMZ95259.1 iron dicitrate transport regulator FecR [Pseudomonas sp. FW305-42]PNA25152.1 iron dicitrate transport regulator FecR [Pseudomonas sp. MPR-R1B]PNB26541.1 iron dicitrate transport regulator FecR [Pseudomonas sp. DP16D-E2]PNB41522.1 iron dicitrate transport regulator FecR [Pseudomonas sp. FW305-17]PNB62114.1 iron dicitrate transport regulator FecR [Pseudomonas sp. GW531-E2]